MIHGVIIVNKEKDFTSHDVVAKLRGICKQKKIGHTGTLDPNATGVLPVCLGNATKLCDLLADHTKTYEAVLLLGITTDTQDMTGNIRSRKNVEVTEDEIRATIRSFTGNILQVPPMYSALKVGGKKLYELARAGVEVERKARPVTIEEIVVEKIEDARVFMRVTCSKGTYIRTLCEDIGNALGCGGCMEELKRTGVGRFSIDEAKTISEIERAKEEGSLSEIVIPVDRIFSDKREVFVTAGAVSKLKNGNVLSFGEVCNLRAEETDEDEIVRVYAKTGAFYGLYRNKEGWLKPYKMFLPDEV